MVLTYGVIFQKHAMYDTIATKCIIPKFVLVQNSWPYSTHHGTSEGCSTQIQVLSCNIGIKKTNASFS